MTIYKLSILSLVWILIAGCSSGANTLSTAYLDVAAESAAVAQAASANQQTGGESKSELSPATGPAINRQIIYHADIAVEVSDIESLSEQINVRLRELKGFVSNFSEQRFAGDRRTATWTIRVDASKFLDLLSWLDKESNVLRKQVTSKDVTEEYVDLNARLENKRSTEKRLVALLEQHSGKLDEVLAFEREIDRTREEIERIEGRLRLLGDQIALSTVTLSASTRVEYETPKPPTLATSIHETWNRSLGSFQNVCKQLLLGFVGITPWLPVMVVAVGGYRLSKWLKRPNRA